MTVIAAKSFPDSSRLPLVADLQFREPYTSGALNRKLRGILAPGFYSGFMPVPGAGLTITITSLSEEDKTGTASLNIGQYQVSVRHQFDIDVPLMAGTSKIIALQAVYGIGIETYQVNSDSTLQAAEIVVLDVETTLTENQLEICRVTIPSGADQVTEDMIDLSRRRTQRIGIELSSAIDSEREDVAANSAAIKRAIAFLKGEGAPSLLCTIAQLAAAINNDPDFYQTLTGLLALKAPLASPVLTGLPTAPTADKTANNTQIATTAFVRSAIADLVASSPETMDTLAEIADALNNDPHFATTMLNQLAGKQPLSNTLTALAGLQPGADMLPYFIGNGAMEQTPFTQLARGILSAGNVNELYAYIGLGNAASRNVGTTAGTVAAGDDSRIVNALQVIKKPLAVDLNTLGQPEHIGIYCQDYDADTKTEFHYPIPLSGTLTVTPAAYGCVQEYTTYSQSRKFIRGLTGPWNGNGPWASWSEVFSENHKPTPNEIGAVPSSGGPVGYLKDAEYYFTKSGVPRGAGGFAGMLDSEAPFYSPNWTWKPTAGGVYVPLVKGLSQREGQGWKTSVSFGYLMQGGAGSFAVPCIQALGDSGQNSVWSFDPGTKTISSDGGFIAGSAKFQNNGDAYGATWNGTLSSWLISSFSLRDQSINARALQSTLDAHVNNLNAAIANKSDTTWVQRYFLNDLALGAEGSFIIAKNAWQRVPGGCVLTGYNAEGDEPVNDTLFYRPIQKYYPLVGWVTIGHLA